MHLSWVSALFWALLILPAASQADFEKRGYCLKDKCQKAVNAGPTTLRGASATAAARKDCASFLAKTVTPCPITKTKTVTVVKTARTVTVTRTAIRSKTATRWTTVVLPVSVTTTPTTTLTLTDTSYLTDQQTDIETITTTHPTVFQTEVVTQTLFQPARRAQPSIIPARHSLEDAHALEARGACPKVKTATKLACYAETACKKSPSAYASACSCLGVKGATTTLPAIRTTKTSTVFKTTTPTRVVTVTVDKTATEKRTSTTKTTVIVTADEATVTEEVTVLATETIITTLTDVVPVFPTEVVSVTTVIPKTCPQFILQAIGSSVDGQYVLSQGGSQKLAFTASSASAAVFRIDGSGKLVTGNNLIANTDNRSLYYVYLETQATIDGAGYLPLICQKTPLLTCAISNGQTRFLVCPSIGPGDPAPGPALLFGTGTGGDCVYISLRTLPAPGCP